jgi:hypothetical protein
MYADLLEKLKAATGPDRALDGDIAEATGAVPEWCVKRSYRQPELWSDNGPGLHAKTWMAERYTGSTDFALALLEKKLPRATYGLSRVNYEVEGKEVDAFRFALGFSEGTATTAPLAILIALVSALHSQGEAK